MLFFVLPLATNHCVHITKKLCSKNPKVNTNKYWKPYYAWTFINSDREMVTFMRAFRISQRPGNNK